MLALPLVLGDPVVAAPGEDPGRGFDFWIGEWSVQNRHLQPDGTWSLGDVTRARITPVLGGQAVLEEWAGPFRGSFMNGFSLRAFDPEAERWVLVLFWTTDGNATFGRLRGRFRHGRGEFLAPETGQQRTRYTFSDALPNSVRWDSATTADAGQTWRTDWIMEFSRTRAAGEVTDEVLFAQDWNAGTLSPHEEARALDWMLGEWRGHVEGGGEELEARLRCRLLDKDCLVLDVLETRAPRTDTGADAGTEDWEGSLHVSGYVASAGTWESWGLSEADTRLRRETGGPDEHGLRFQRTDPVTGNEHTRMLVPFGADRMRIEEVFAVSRAGAPGTLRTILLERAGG